MAKFIRTNSKLYSRLGRRRKKKQIYRRARGGENKIRLKMKGHTTNVSIGYRNEKSNRDLIKGLKPVLIYNPEDLKKIGKDNIGIIAKIGGKKKAEIARKASEGKVKIANLNPEKFLVEIEEKIKKRKEKRMKKIEKKKAAEKKAKPKKEKKENQTESETEIKQEIPQNNPGEGK